MKNELETKIKENHKVTSVQDGENQIKTRIEKIEYIKRRANDLTSESAVKYQTEKVLKEADEKLAVQKEILKNFMADAATYNTLDSKYQKLSAEAEEYYRTKVSVTQRRKQQNQKTVFSGMDSDYDGTGLETVIVIDENDYPHSPATAYGPMGGIPQLGVGADDYICFDVTLIK